MTLKYQHKYRIQSARLANWDYGWDGAYFVTICTCDQVCIFGDIVGKSDEDATMQLSEIGTIANDCWIQIPQHFPFTRLGVPLIMPNHVHGIVIIDKPPDANDGGAVDVADAVGADVGVDVDVDGDVGVDRNGDTNAQTNAQPADPANPDKPPGGVTKNKNPMLHDNLSRVIRWYKGRATFECRKIHADFGWQSRFHDHVIRDGDEFDRISDYIANNPKKWKQDRFHPK